MWLEIRSYLRLCSYLSDTILIFPFFVVCGAAVEVLSAPHFFQNSPCGQVALAIARLKAVRACSSMPHGPTNRQFGD